MKNTNQIKDRIVQLKGSVTQVSNGIKRLTWNDQENVLSILTEKEILICINKVRVGMSKIMDYFGNVGPSGNRSLIFLRSPGGNIKRDICVFVGGLNKFISQSEIVLSCQKDIARKVFANLPQGKISNIELFNHMNGQLVDLECLLKSFKSK